MLFLFIVPIFLLIIFISRFTCSGRSSAFNSLSTFGRSGTFSSFSAFSNNYRSFFYFFFSHSDNGDDSLFRIIKDFNLIGYFQILDEDNVVHILDDRDIDSEIMRQILRERFDFNEILYELYLSFS